MRILLIKPPIRGCLLEIGRHTPIGLAYLSSILRGAGHETFLFDSLAFTEDNHVVAPGDLTATDRIKIDRHPRWRHVLHWGAGWPRIEAAIAEAEPDVIGISCMFTPYYETAYELARLARRVAPAARILFGAQHATVAPRHVLAEPEVDVVALGEAEATIVPLVEALAEGRGLTALEGVAFRCGEGLCECGTPAADGCHVQPKTSWLEDLDSLPFPRAEQLAFDRYDHATTLITSRGCPFACTFCTVHAMVGKRFRARSPSNVVDEIEHYVERFGVRRFLIEDDNFTFDVDRVAAICDEIRARDLSVELRLPNGMTVVKLTRDLVETMTGAGFRDLFLGLETTDPKRLREIRKGFTSLDKVAEGSAWFTESGATVSASLIVGLPGQPLDEVARDVGNLLFRRIRFWSNPFYPIPASPDYDRCIEQGLITADTEYALFDQFNFAIGSDRLSPEELYWAWVTTQALAQWSAYVEEGFLRRWSGETVGFEQALDRLLAFNRPPLAAADRRMEVPALPVAAEPSDGGVRVTVDPEHCFCAVHRLEERHQGGGPLDSCLFSGDVMAAAVACYAGLPVAADQVESSVRTPGASCAFVLRREPRGWEVQRTFVETIDAHRADYLAVRDELRVAV